MKLFKHQQDIIDCAKDHKYYAVFADCGTGKTRCAIELAKHYGKTLVVAPNTVLENWADEVLKFSDLVPLVLQGTKARRIKLLREPADIYIINYEALRILRDDLMRANFSFVVFDESQKLKGYKTLQSKAAFRLSQVIEKRLIMTGTPVTNSPLDIFGQYRVLNPNIFGFSFYRFRNHYTIMGGYGGFQVKNYINIDELQGKIYQCAIRVRKEDCLSLPKKLFQTHYVDLSAEQMTVYKALKRDFIAELQGQFITAPQVLTRLIRLSQVTAGFAKSEDAQEINFATNPKLIWLREFIESLPKDEKVVVFCRFVKEIHNVAAMLHDMKISHSVISGSVKQSERQGIIKDFQTYNTQIFIGQIQTAGIGINLHSARYCVFLSNSYSHGVRLQCEERCHRIGQTRNVTYLDVACRDTIDLTILKCLKTKEDIAKVVIEQYAERQNYEPNS